MAEETLCLRWNDFHDIAQTSFRDLKNDKDFMDVTLACEDQRVQAHKVILSACSPFFKRLLKTHTHPQPLVYLRRTKFVNLIAMVDFIYTGEVNILQDHLESFLAFAEELELKGLGGNSEGDTSRSQNEMFIPKEENGTFLKMDACSARNIKINDSILERAVIPTQKRKTALLVDPATMATIESMIEQRVGEFSCIKCGYASNRISNVKDHIERKHIEGMEYPCTSCDKVFRSSNAIRVHKIQKGC